MSAPRLVRNLIFAVAFLLPAGLARAEGALTRVGSLHHGAQRLDLSMFTEDGQTVALISIADGQRGPDGKRRDISLAVGPAEWNALEALWARGQSLATNASALTVAGDFHEVGTPDPTTLTLSSGPVVRLVLQSRDLGLFTFDLSREETPGFEACLRTITQTFSERTTASSPR